MRNPGRCERCGSVGSIEFDMCQVCLYDYSSVEDDPGFSLVSLPAYASEARADGAVEDRRESEREVVFSA